MKIKISKSEQLIINAAQVLVNNGELPTVRAIREQLGFCGSNSTIHKYLSKWKQQCFEHSNNQNILSEPNISIEEKRNLEQALNKQITQNEHYASELINTEKTIIKLKEENQQLQTAKQEFQLKLTETTAGFESLEKHYQELKIELNHNHNEIISKQQKIIDELRAEIKLINTTSIAAIQHTSNSGHELLMQEKVQIINLQTKIDSLNKQLTETNQQLTAALIKVQIGQQQSAWQQQLIQKFIDAEQLQKLELEELQLRSIAKVRGSYGT